MFILSIVVPKIDNYYTSVRWIVSATCPFPFNKISHLLTIEFIRVVYTEEWVKVGKIIIKWILK